MFIFYSCAPHTASYIHQTECMTNNSNGTKTVRAWGYGKNRWIAIEDAKKNALREIIFKGLLKGGTECNTNPIISELNAEERYQNYFSKFFSSSGIYKSYISNENEPLRKKIFRKKIAITDKGALVNVILTINYEALRKRFISDGILK